MKSDDYWNVRNEGAGLYWLKLRHQFIIKSFIGVGHSVTNYKKGSFVKRVIQYKNKIHVGLHE